jgi:hypothetical protein
VPEGRRGRPRAEEKEEEGIGGQEGGFEDDKVKRCSAPVWHNLAVRFLRMKPGHGEVLIAEGDVELPQDERRLVAEFRHQLDAGLWAAVPVAQRDGRREAVMVRSFAEVPRDAERVIFFPRAAGG